MCFKQVGKQLLYGRSSIFGAMAWMFVTSFVLMVLVGWIPVAGPFIGPAVGGYIGGRRAGSAGRAALAAVLPAMLSSLLIVGLTVIVASVTNLPILGAAGAVVAGAFGVVLVMHNMLLFVSALVGGWSRHIQTA